MECLCSCAVRDLCLTEFFSMSFCKTFVLNLCMLYSNQSGGAFEANCSKQLGQAKNYFLNNTLLPCVSVRTGTRPLSCMYRPLSAPSAVTSSPCTVMMTSVLMSLPLHQSQWRFQRHCCCSILQIKTFVADASSPTWKTN